MKGGRLSLSDTVAFAQKKSRRKLRMRKVLVFATLAILIACSASASVTRVTGMLGSNIWPVFAVEDDSLINFYPSKILSYPNSAVLEYNGNTWGYLNMPAFNGVLSVSGGNYDMTDTSGVGYGFKIGGMPAGFSLSYRDGYYTNNHLKTDLPLNPGKDFSKTGSFDIEAKGGITLGDKNPWDLGLTIEIPHYESPYSKTYDTTGYLANEQYDGTVFALDPYIFARTTSGSWTYSLALYNYFENSRNTNKNYDASGNLIAGSSETLYSNVSIDYYISALDEIKISDNTSLYLLVQPDIWRGNYNSKSTNLVTKATTGTTDSNWYGIWIPAAFGTEAKVNDTWTLRGGATFDLLDYSWSGNINKNAAGTVTYNSQNNSFSIATNPGVSLGSTLSVGGFKLDAWLNYNLLLSGPNIISGANNSLTSSIAITYLWK